MVRGRSNLVSAAGIALAFALLTKVSDGRLCLIACGTIFGITSINIIFGALVLAIFVTVRSLYFEYMMLSVISESWWFYPYQFMPLSKMFYESLILSGAGSVFGAVGLFAINRGNPEAQCRARWYGAPSFSLPTNHLLFAIFLLALSNLGLYLVTHRGEEVKISREFKSLNRLTFDELSAKISNDETSQSERVKAILVLSGLGLKLDDTKKRISYLEDYISKASDEKTRLAAKFALQNCTFALEEDSLQLPYYSSASIQEMSFFSMYDLIRGRWVKWGQSRMALT